MKKFKMYEMSPIQNNNLRDLLKSSRFCPKETDFINKSDLNDIIEGIISIYEGLGVNLNTFNSDNLWVNFFMRVDIETYKGDPSYHKYVKICESNDEVYVLM
jgi:hypothetical protein